MVSWCVPCKQPLRWQPGTRDWRTGWKQADWWVCSNHWCTVHLFPTYVGTFPGVRTSEQKAFMLLLGNPPLSAEEAVEKAKEES